jgi:hypothetical protein
MDGLEKFVMLISAKGTHAFAIALLLKESLYGS